MKTTFRGLATISAMSIVLLLANCSKDGDPAPDDVIVGKWTTTTSNATVTVGSQSLVDFFISEGKTPEQAQDDADAFVAQYHYQGLTLEFKNDGALSIIAGGFTNTGTWELTSDRKTLTMANPNETVYTVATLTSHNLNMTTDLTYDYVAVEFKSDGTISTKESVFSIHLDMALTK